MSSQTRSRRAVAAVAVAVVAFAFWRALIGGGSLVSHDIVATAPPFDSYRSEAFSLENGPGDPINIHAHWAPLAEKVRSGDFSWWNRALAAGQPTMKGGLPVFDLLYLLVPAWFAPGLVAAARALAAIGLTGGFLRSVGLRRVSALAGGLAFGFSGFMVGWMNWPHSSVAALAPGLLWAVEKLIRRPRLWRAVPVAAAVAAMVWSNFPQVTIYVLLGAAIYAVIRLSAERSDGRYRRQWKHLFVAGATAAVLAVGMALPHVVGFLQYLDWADTSQRGLGPDDSSAGAEYLLTAFTPAVWGSDALEVPWFGVGNWVEFNAHAGTAVVILAVVGLAAGVHADRRRRSVVVALATMATVGVLVAYIGGPVGTFVSGITGPSGGLMTRAKILLSLGLALLAAFAVEEVADGWTFRDKRVRTVVRWSVVSVAVFGVAMLPSMLHWVRRARALGVVEETIASAVPALIGGGLTIAVLFAVGRRWLSGSAAAWSLVAVMTYELLSFAMPVPTIVSRSERLSATPAHQVALDALQPGQRLAGEGRTFFPGTTAQFGLDHALGPVLMSPGQRALLRAVDPAMLDLRGGGTPTYPNVVVDTDQSSPVWDALAVGLWSQFPDSTPPGPVLKPDFGVAEADPGVAVLTGSTVVAEGGVRAVVIDTAIRRPGPVTVEVTIDGEVFTDSRGREQQDWRLMPTAVLGENFEPGTPIEVRMWAAEEGTASVSVDGSGGLLVGTIAGGDEFRLIRTGDVLLTERLTSSFARLFDAAVLTPDPEEGAAVVAGREDGGGPAAVDSEVGLPTVADPNARLAIVSTLVEPDRAVLTTDTDRPALLVVSQTAYPGWRATIDGESVEVVTGDATFTAVVVPAGVHQVEFEFEPTHLRWTMTIFVLSAAMALAILLRAGPTRRSRSPTVRLR